MNALSTIRITGTGLFTPENQISNQELVASFNAFVELHNTQHAEAIAAGTITALSGSSPEFIERASGIKSRYVIDKAGVLDPSRMCPNIPERPNDQWSIQAEIGTNAAQKALVAAQLSANDIDAVIVACSNLQRAYPAVAIEIQAALGMTGGYGFDMNVACSAATFGIQQAVNAIKSGSAKRVLVINPEITSGHLNWRVRDSHFIFGDVATAMVIEGVETNSNKPGFDILDSKLLTQFSNNIRNNFGFLNRADDSGVGNPDKLFVQDGRKVFKEVSPLVAETLKTHLSECNLELGSIKRFWLHQANANMNALIMKLLMGEPTFDPILAPIILDEYANTSSAGSIIAFHKHNQDFTTGDVGIICSFGAGYSIGSVIVKKV